MSASGARGVSGVSGVVGVTPADGVGQPSVAVLTDADLGGVLPRTGAAYVVLGAAGHAVDPAWVATLQRRLDAEPEVAAAGGGLRRYTLDPTSGDLRPVREPVERVGEVTTLGLGPMLWRRAALLALDAPLLHPAFESHYRHVDLCTRALRGGWRLLHDPAAPAGAPPPESDEAAWLRDRWRFAHRHLDTPRVRALSQRALSRAALARLPWRRQDPRAQAEGAAAAWARSHAAELAAARHATRGGRSLADAIQASQSRARYYDFARPEVMALVPPGARIVVDVGCAAGALGRALKAARPGVEVRGVEPNEDAAARAREVLNDVFVAGAEAAPPPQWPAPDCLVFADVLEHLADPWAVLAAWAARLAPGGTVVMSLPNVAHHSVVRQVLTGRFDYEDAGILDRTHLRFFTRETALALVEGAGLELVHLGRVAYPRRDLRRLVHRWTESTGDVAGARGYLADLDTMQLLLVARAR